MKNFTQIAFTILLAAALAVPFLSSPSSAGECKKDYVAPEGVTLMPESEIVAALKGNTLDAWRNREVNTYMLYYREDGDLLILRNNRIIAAKWAVCGPVIVMGTRERLVANAGDGKLSFYDAANGTLVGTFSVIRGKSREF